MNIKEILKPIVGDNSPIGKPNNQSEFLHDADSEIMKIGSLQHDEIDWEIINTQSIEYLKKVCKDYKVISFLVRYVLHTKESVKVINFLGVLTKFNEQYLFSSYPAPNSTSEIKSSKAKILKMIIGYLDSYITNHLVDSDDINLLNKLSLFFTTLQDQLSTNKPLLTYAEKINKTLNLKKESVLQTTDDKQSKDNGERVLANKEKGSQREKKVVELPTLVPSELSLNSIRDIKSSYLKLAEHNNKAFPSSPLGYQLRRYAMWHSITVNLLKNKSGVTDMTSVPNDRVSDYKKELEMSSHSNLLRKIEKTLETSPFWIEGNYLSFLCAKSLGYSDVSTEIQKQTITFIAKFPEFYDMKFVDGTPFISDDATQWIAEQKTIDSQETVLYDNTELRECYEKKGLLGVLGKIDKEYKKATDIRGKFNLRLEKINYLIKENVQSIAVAELKELKKLAKEYSVPEWENSFFKTIDIMLNQLDR